MWIAQIILATVGLYAAVGLLVGAWFVTRGVERVDAVARGAPWGFRLSILPGTAALWPLLLLKSRRAFRRGASE